MSDVLRVVSSTLPSGLYFLISDVEVVLFQSLLILAFFYDSIGFLCLDVFCYCVFDCSHDLF